MLMLLQSTHFGLQIEGGSINVQIHKLYTLFVVVAVGSETPFCVVENGCNITVAHLCEP